MKDFRQIFRTIVLLVIATPVLLAFSYQFHLHVNGDEGANVVAFTALGIAVIIVCLQWAWHLHDIFYDDFKNTDNE